MPHDRQHTGQKWNAGVLWLVFALCFPIMAHSQDTLSEPAWKDVKEVLDKRCVVCHSCYDAPCQLKLTSPQGILRGASQQPVYHTERLSDAQPTRLGIDATTVAGWRDLGFFSVTRDPQQAEASANLIERYLELGRQTPLSTNAPVPQALELAVDRTLVCPTPDQFDAFAKNNPLAGMPYAAAALGDDEYATLAAWARAGAVVPTVQTEVPEDIQRQLAEWEAFLNASDMRTQLMSRYLYEHLFLAHLYFVGDDPRRFFQLVRSRTPYGQEIDVIATRRPFDSPGDGPFYYRLRVIDETIVHKEHLVYSLGADRMARYQELFLDSDWTLAGLPPYGDAEGGDPFTTFASLPPRSRYQFLLDDALFFVRSFIRGPVCHGATAVDVIEDRFWVSFLDPDADLSVTDPSFLQDGAAFLELPVAQVDRGKLGDLHGLSHKNQVRYLEFRDARYRASPAHQQGFGYDAIWDGEGTNTNALLTVFRNFDNASAMTGFHGAIPETAWVIDYPVFERIYYDLVAGFDVFGRIEHQLATRLYMDELRMESEDLFLTFMPRESRPEIHKSWYSGPLAQLHTYWHQRRVDDTFPTGIAYATNQPKQEFLLALLARGGGLWPLSDPINRCTDETCRDQALRTIAAEPGHWAKFFPDLSVLIIETPDKEDQIFTIAHDKAHSNIAFLFHEPSRRQPDEDVLTILPGLFGSYPNFFFRVPQAQLDVFTEEVKSIATQEDYLTLVNNFGVRRTSPNFWPSSDQLHQAFAASDPLQAGIFDLNRYKDPKPDDTPE
ncbi:MULTISPECIES: fatty acid cis/trans isomerase [unclassified Ruegeria]|uniref:fatty acid cis/trans isomerase n=1 Tax=unclassified Ruegeria TaxID=2625375 RepID=UPI0020C1CD7D|nr:MULTISPECIES: fatty acid cis/trans isomerase [unclassified Ruegeria]